MTSISINQFLARVDLKQVAYIESLCSTPNAKSLGEAFGSPQTILSFLGAPTLLSAQSLDYFRALAHGHVLEVSAPVKADGAQGETRLIPIDAIHHLEMIDDEDLDSALAEGGSGHARIIYNAYNPANPERRFEMDIPATLIDDLLDCDSGALLDIGRGQFVFADTIEDARALKPRQIARLAGERLPDSPRSEPPVSVIELQGGAFIPSSFCAHTIEGLVGRPLPSAGSSAFYRRKRVCDEGCIGSVC